MRILLRVGLSGGIAVLSFVVPAHNEEAVIEAALRAIHDAAGSLGRPYEIIVVDDDSTDRTAELAAGLGARVERVALRKISAVRNAGSRVAAGEWLFFVDADTLVNPALLAAACAALERGEVGGGATVAFDGRVPLWARATTRLMMIAFRCLRLAAGCFVYCRRDVFEAIGGFDETLYAAEELALSRAMNQRGRFRVLPQPVLTSGRKLRTHTLRELLGSMLRVGWRGEQALRRGDSPEMQIWYGPRRPNA